MVKISPDVFFSTGPGTIVEPAYLKLLENPPANEDEIKVHQFGTEHRVFMQGRFEGFHLYFIVTHDRFQITPGSVRKINDLQFTAHITLGENSAWAGARVVTFNSPLIPFVSVSDCSYGLTSDSFEIALYDNPPQKFPCSLSFFTEYSTDAQPIPLELVYVGMAERNGRQAHNRLGEGHEKLQQVLAEQGMQGGKKATSIVMYRPSGLEPLLDFAEVVETIEASIIQHFHTAPLNVEHLNFPKNPTQLTGKLKKIGINIIETLVEAPAGTTIHSSSKPVRLKDHSFIVQIPK